MIRLGPFFEAAAESSLTSGQVVFHSLRDEYFTQVDAICPDAREFRAWCEDAGITIEPYEGSKKDEIAVMTEDQRFAFKMRWGF